MSVTSSILIHGNETPVRAEPGITREELERALECKKFRAWATELDPRFYVRAVHIQSVDFFGKKVGFIKFNADLTGRNPDGLSDGKPIPGIMLMRGHIVTILVVLLVPRVSQENEPHDSANCDEYTAAVVQPRPATCQFAFRETTAGMVDDRDPLDAAVAELGEELGFDDVTRNDLIDLWAASYETPPPFFSPGTSDSKCHFFLYQRVITRDELTAMEGKHTGVATEDERIHLEVMPLAEIAKLNDMKTALAYCLYQQWKSRR